MSMSSAAANGGSLRSGRLAAFGALLVLDFVIAAVMLVTDKNLQTDFGAQSAYYSHWYGVLAMGVIDLLVGAVLLSSSTLPALKRMSASAQRRGVIAALLWTVLALVVSLGIVASYMQVGFSSASQFAQYLFGVTPYPGALSYIPGLYDALIALYVVTAIVGALATVRGHHGAPAA
jgi:hypothetical protein